MEPFDWADAPKQTAFPIAKPGYPYIFASAFVTAVFAMIGIGWITVSGVLVTFFICYFFRDPDRITPTAERAVISPADGKVVHVSVVDSNPFISGKCVKIGIFMSIFNVHVNRIPFSGKVKKIAYQPGKFFTADKEAASTQNEHNAVTVETKQNQKICFVQIAGLIARRIICRLQEGDEAIRGQRFGMICFGSRVDVYLPFDTKVEIAKGDKVAAGATILGFIQ